MPESQLSPTGRCPAAQKGHGTKDAVMKDRWSNRDHRRIRPGIKLKEEQEEDGRSVGVNWCATRAPMEPGSKTSRNSCVIETRGQPENLQKSTGLKIAKWIARCTVGLQRIKDWTLWRSQPPPKQKKNAHRGGAGNVEALTPTTSERTDRTLSGVTWEEYMQGGSGGSGWRVITANPTPKKNQQREHRARERYRETETLQEQPSEKTNSHTLIGYSGRTALRREQCQETLES
jgi:hypothetical protein